MKRVIKLTSLVFALALVALLIFISWFVNSQTGLVWALGQADRLAGVSVQAETPTGSLWHGVRARSLRITTDDIAVHSNQVNVAWQIHFFPLSLSIRSLTADAVHLTVPASTHRQAPSSPFAGPWLEGPGLAVVTPLPLRLRNLEVGQISVTDGVEQGLNIQLAEVQGSAGWIGQELTASLSVLAADYDQARLTLSGDLRLNNMLRHNIKLDFENSHGQAQLASKGTVQRLDIELNQTFTGDTAKIIISDAHKAQPQLDLVINGPTRQARLLLSNPEFELTFSGTPIWVDVPGPTNGALSGSIAAWPQVDFDRVNVESEHYGHAQLSGDINVDTLLAQVSGQTRLNGEVFDASLGTISAEIAAEADIGQSVVNAQLTGDAQVLGRPLTLNKAQLGLDANGLTATELQVDSDAGQVAGQLAVQFEPLTLQGHATFSGLNIAAIDPALVAWPSKLDGAVELRWQADRDHWQVDLPAASGWVLQRPMTANGHLELVQGQVSAGGLSAVSGQSSVELDLLSEQRLQFDIAVADLERWYKFADGRLHASGQLAMHDPWRSTGTLDAEALSIHGVSIDRLVAQANGEWSLTATDIQYQGYQADQVQMVATGSQQLLDGSLQITAPWGRIDTVAELDLANDMLQLQTLNANIMTLPRWSLRAPTAIAMNPWSLQSPLCLQSKASSLCAEERTEQIHIQAERINVETLSKVWLYGNNAVSLSGELDARATIGRSDLYPLGLRIEGRDLALQAPDQVPLPIREVSVDARVDGSIEVTGSIITDVGSISGRSLWPDSEQALSQRPMQGQLQMDIDTLDWLAYFSPEIGQTGGRVEGQFELAGTLAQPQLAGRALAADLQAFVSRTGTDLRDGTVELSGSLSEPIQLSGDLQFAEGSASLGGSLRWQAQKADARLAVTASEPLLLANTDDLQLRLTPDLQLTLKDQLADLRGTLRVAKSSIHLTPVDASVQRSDDVVFVNEPTPPSAYGEKTRLQADLTLIIDEALELQGFGLEGTLNGQLRITATAADQARATGELSIGGTYTIYGQTLTLRRGKLIYADTAIDNPLIQLEAVRDTEGGVVGAKVSGRASQPMVKLFSEPQMTDAEILARLVTGRPLNAASSGQASALSSAALALGLSRYGGTGQAASERLGFEELSLSFRDDIGGAALTLGRYLSPKLYLSYTYGLVEQFDLLQLNYLLSDKWTIQTEVGVESRAAIKYRIERD